MGLGFGLWGAGLWGTGGNTPATTETLPQLVNSTTYVDLLGLQLGLDRLQGEPSSYYVKRLEAASSLTRAHPYEGALNEVNLQLGTVPANYIDIQVPSNVVITVSIAGIEIAGSPVIPILTFDGDTMWRWRMLSDITSDINAIMPATLLSPDGPAFQLARQSNSIWSFSEAVTGIQTRLQHSGIQVGTEMLSQTSPRYSLTPDGLLTFAVEPPSGTQITYNYVMTPYTLVGSPIVLIGLTDDNFSSVAATSTSALAYQVSEFVQNIMTLDRSYWAK